jgi:hypothetical protein
MARNKTPPQEQVLIRKTTGAVSHSVDSVSQDTRLNITEDKVSRLESGKIQKLTHLNDLLPEAKSQAVPQQYTLTDFPSVQSLPEPMPPGILLAKPTKTQPKHPESSSEHLEQPVEQEDRPEHLILEAFDDDENSHDGLVPHYLEDTINDDESSKL